MRCPACKRTLTEMKAGDILVEVCEGGCGGIWFGNSEVQMVDEKHEHTGVALLDIARDESIVVGHEERRNCPKCSMIMMRHFWSVKSQVEVDRCPKCNGLWLDVGELSGIRSMYKTEEARRQAAASHFSVLFDEELMATKAESDEELAKHKQVYNVFRFICPSYYMRGLDD